MPVIGNANNLKNENPWVCPGDYALEVDTGFVKFCTNKYESVRFNNLEYFHHIIPVSGGSGGTVDLSSYVTLNLFNTEINSLKNRVAALEGALGGAFNGSRDVTQIPAIGDNYGGNTVIQFLENMFFPPEPLSVDLDGDYLGIFENSITLETMLGGGPLSMTANYTVSRGETSREIATIVVDGVNKTFAQPNQGFSVVGAHTFSVTRNVDKTVILTATDVGGDSQSSQISVNFRWKRYWGFIDTPNPDDFEANLDILPSNQKEFHTNIAKSSFNAVHPNPGNSKYLVIAMNADFLDAGKNVVITIGGLDQTGTFVKTTQNLTNESGATTSYMYFISQNTLTTDLNNIVISEV